MRLKGDQGTTRQMNRRLIVNLLRSDGPMSRSEISNRTGLSPAAVTFVVSGLIEENLLAEGKTSQGGTGRRPIPVDINYAGKLVIGFKLMAGSIEGVLTDLSTTVLTSKTFLLPEQTPECVVRSIKKATRELLELKPIPEAELTGIGISLPGTIDSENGICHRSSRFKWRTVPLASMVAEQVHVPVWLDDDTNAYALAQNLFGPGRRHKTFGALAIGAGIHCAIVINGSVHHGANGAAGKLGHVVIDPEGPLCECGRRGCLQTFYSEPAIVERWRRMKNLNDTVTRFDLVEAAKSGDEQTRTILREAGQKIGEQLSFFCNLIDPEIIVVGGEAVAFGDYFFNPMRETLTMKAHWNAPEIVPDWADNSWAQGAAALATQQLFDFESVGGKRRQSDEVFNPGP